MPFNQLSYNEEFISFIHYRIPMTSKHCLLIKGAKRKELKVKIH